MGKGENIIATDMLVFCRYRCCASVNGRTKNPILEEALATGISVLPANSLSLFCAITSENRHSCVLLQFLHPLACGR